MKSTKSQDIGIGVKAPKKTCEDQNCPFHSNLGVRGNSFVGLVLSTKMRRTATVEWNRKYFIPKYERYENRRSKVKVHNPECLGVSEGDKVRIMGCKPLSKTKNFVIVENLGKAKGYEQLKESREEGKFKSEKKESRADLENDESSKEEIAEDESELKKESESIEELQAKEE